LKQNDSSSDDNNKNADQNLKNKNQEIQNQFKIGDVTPTQRKLSTINETYKEFPNKKKFDYDTSMEDTNLRKTAKP